MAQIIGRQIELGVGVETTRGTPKSTADIWNKKISATILEKAEKVNDESTRNVLADSLGTRVVKKWVEGDLEGNVHADAIGYFLYNLYGIVTTTEVVPSTVYSHEFTLENSITHPSLSLFAKDGTAQQSVFDTCMISSLEISAEQDAYVNFTASFMGSEASSNTDTPNYNKHYDFIGRDVTIKLADTEAGLTGATPTKVKNLSIKWDTGLIDDYVLGEYSPDGIYNAMMSIEGEFEKNFEDETFKDLYLTDAYKYMLITIEGAENIGSGNKPKLEILLNKVAVTEWERDDSASDLVKESISFKAFHNETDNQQSKVTLVNVTSQYDTIQ